MTVSRPSVFFFSNILPLYFLPSTDIIPSDSNSAVSETSDAKILTKNEEVKDDSTSNNNDFDFGDLDFDLEEDIDDNLREPQRIEKVTKKKKTVIIPGTDYTPIIIGVSVGAGVLVALGVFLLIFFKKRINFIP